jgi:hypothetical protein
MLVDTHGMTFPQAELVIYFVINFLFEFWQLMTFMYIIIKDKKKSYKKNI